MPKQGPNCLISFLKKFVIGCRIYILLSPSFTTGSILPTSNKLIYDLNFFCSIIVVLKILLVLRKKRRMYFRYLAPSIDFLANLGVLFSSLLYMANSIFKLDSNNLEHYYFWAFCCLCNSIAVFNHLNKFKIVSETLSVILLALKLNYPFLFVIIVMYLMMATIGGWVFGGVINSSTHEKLERVGQGFKEEYVFHNWNDFLNSLVMLWGMNLSNNLNVYVNMSTYKENGKRGYSASFFFFFYVLNNVVLRNIFIGQIIEISMEYFKNLYLEEKRIKKLVKITENKPL